jgi:hypothetical protein
MSNDDHDLDILLRRNAERQLAGFDWDRFRRGMDSRLTGARAPIRSWYLQGRWAALAAVVALTAGVLLWAVFCASGPGRGEPGAGWATVALIQTTHAPGMAQVSFSPVDPSARGEVTILASDRPREDRVRASWCIIAPHELAGEKRRQSDDASDVLCLF